MKYYLKNYLKNRVVKFLFDCKNTFQWITGVKTPEQEQVRWWRHQVRWVIPSFGLWTPKSFTLTTRKGREVLPRVARQVACLTSKQERRALTHLLCVAELLVSAPRPAACVASRCPAGTGPAPPRTPRGLLPSPRRCGRRPRWDSRSPPLSTCPRWPTCCARRSSNYKRSKKYFRVLRAVTPRRHFRPESFRIKLHPRWR